MLVAAASGAWLWFALETVSLVPGLVALPISTFAFAEVRVVLLAALAEVREILLASLLKSLHRRHRCLLADLLQLALCFHLRIGGVVMLQGFHGRFSVLRRKDDAGFDAADHRPRSLSLSPFVAMPRWLRTAKNLDVSYGADV